MAIKKSVCDDASHRHRHVWINVDADADDIQINNMFLHDRAPRFRNNY